MIKNNFAKALFGTGEDKHLFVLRVTLGTIFFAHGLQKTLGWFGSPGYDGMMQGLTQQHIPAPLAWLAIMAELLGGLDLMVGLLTRLAALGIVVNIVATLTVGLSNGLFMNWSANQRGEGIEYNPGLKRPRRENAVVCVHFSGRGGRLYAQKEQEATPAEDCPPTA